MVKWPVGDVFYAILSTVHTIVSVGRFLMETIVVFRVTVYTDNLGRSMQAADNISVHGIYIIVN